MEGRSPLPRWRCYWPHQYLTTDFSYKLRGLCGYKLRIPYFLNFFPRVLLISVPARMWVQFEGGNKTRVGSISLGSKVHAVYRVLAHMLSADLMVLLIQNVAICFCFRILAWSRKGCAGSIRVYSQSTCIHKYKYSMQPRAYHVCTSAHHVCTHVQL